MTAAQPTLLATKGKTPRHCCYDWREGSENVLVCQVCQHPHAVVRWLSLGHDLLEELLSRGMLIGKALREARSGPRAPESRVTP
jgi:hypothetical protein